MYEPKVINGKLESDIEDDVLKIVVVIGTTMHQLQKHLLTTSNY